MTKIHEGLFACTSVLDSANPEYAVAANMSVDSRAMRRIGGFDLQLGPGGKGYGEDYLLLQMARRAGLQIQTRFELEVEHRFDDCRLKRESILAAGRRHGATSAYLAYHWHHEKIAWPLMKAWLRLARLWLWRLAHPFQLVRIEGCAECELTYVRSYSHYLQYELERRRPRRYSTPLASCIPSEDRVWK